MRFYMQPLIKCLICFFVVLAGMAARQTGHEYINESTFSENTALSVLQKDASLFTRHNWFTREKVVNVHDVPLLERREKEDDDDDVRSLRSRLTSICISSLFLKLGCADLLARIFPAGPHDGPHHTSYGLYLVLQVFKI